MGRFRDGTIQDRLMLAHGAINALQSLAEYGLDQEHGVEALVALCRFLAEEEGFLDDAYLFAGPGAHVGGRDFSSAHAAVSQLAAELVKRSLGPCLEREMNRHESVIAEGVERQKFLDVEQGGPSPEWLTRHKVEDQIQGKLLVGCFSVPYVTKELPAIRRRMKGFTFLTWADLQSLRALVVREAYKADADQERDDDPQGQVVQLEATCAKILAALHAKGSSMLVAGIAVAVRRDEKTVRPRLKELVTIKFVSRLRGHKGYVLTERGQDYAERAPAKFPLDSR